RQIVIDWQLIKQMMDAAEQLQQHGIEGTLTVQDLLNMPELVRIEEQPLADEHFEESFRLLLEEAVQQLLQMRLKEGLHLQRDIAQRVKKLTQHVSKIEEKSGQAVILIRDRLR